MADPVVITTLGKTAFNGSFVNQLNNNLEKLATAINDYCLWRVPYAGGTSTSKSAIDMNGFAILNATLGNNALPVLELIARLKQAEKDIADLKAKLAQKD